MTDHEIVTLAHIREALGIGHKPMLSELPELTRRIRLGYERYEKVRKLSLNEFHKIYMRAREENLKFDDLIDELT